MEQESNKAPLIIIGQDLRKLRIHAQKTTSEMAQLIGVKSRKTIENWERDLCHPTINAFIMYCIHTGFNPGKVVAEVLIRNQQDTTQQAGIDLKKCLD